MKKDRIFFLALIIIYLLFLSKDYFIKFSSSFFAMEEVGCKVKDDYYKQEYEKIKQLLEIESKEYQISYSKVIERDIYGFFDGIMINKGKAQGYKPGDIVLNEKGLVGVINEIKNNYSEVNLITNPKTNISVKIGDSYGILGAKDNKLVVKNVKLNTEIKKDDKVYTSGLTTIPEGILVGRVGEIKTDDLGLEYILEIEAAVDFFDLNYVGVVQS
ncbi:MAG: rod shape-determining protein MreC [Bacilli bacterium]|nr:rod shape-determining protein MreC [Bacilli bacterium]